MSIDKLIELSQRAGMQEVTPLVIEYETLKGNYQPPEKALLCYLTAKYLHGDKKNFITWYGEHQDLFDSKHAQRKPMHWGDKDVLQHQLGRPLPPEVIQDDLHHVAQENKLRRLRGGDYFP